MLNLEQCILSLGPDDSHKLGFYRQYIEYFYTTSLKCITAGSRIHGCVSCHRQKLSCRQAWTCITKSVRLINGSSVVPESVSDFANFLGIALVLNLPYTEARGAIDGLGCPVDDTLVGLRKRLGSLTFRGNATVQALLHGATSEMWFRSEKPCAFVPSSGIPAVEETRELYTTLATALAESPGPDPTQPLPLVRNARSLRFSGEVTFTVVMLASCWFRDYDPSSIPPVLEIWCAWFPSRQSDAYECFVPANHQYVATGPHDARCELEGHNGRGVVNFTLRSLLPRVRRLCALDINSFRNIMAFRSGLLVSDSVSRDNRDISAYVQTAGNLIGLTDPSEAGDLWSGQPLVELDRVDLYIRQVKHLTVCTPSPRNIAIIYSFLYSLTSPRHNTRIRGQILPHFEESVSCCPAPFCGQNASPCELDRDLPPSRGSARNPLNLVLQAVLREGLSAEEWQADIDVRIRLCHEWSRGLQPQLGQYDPVAAAVDVAPLCIRIMLRLAQLT